MFQFTERSFGALIPENPADRYDEESERYLARLTADRATPPRWDCYMHITIILFNTALHFRQYDARTLGLVTPVKNQKQCGSCAAFSAVATMESCFLKASKTTTAEMPDLSEQSMLDCGYNGQ